jgi:hypothetical protein
MIPENFSNEFFNLSVSLQLLVVAFALLGALFGAIFVLDGWMSSSVVGGNNGDKRTLLKSPKFLGLTYVISAGVLPILTDVVRSLGSDDKVQSGLAIATYSLFVAISAIVGVMFFSIYSFIVAYSYIKFTSPRKPFWEVIARSLPLVSIALQKGNEAFLTKLDYLSWLEESATQAVKQRDDSIAFLTGAFDRLNKNTVNHVSGIEEFIKFSADYLTVFVEVFFEGKYASEDCRASLYILNSANENSQQGSTDPSLLFICGHSPSVCNHTRRYLSFSNSLAGYALKNPGQVWVYSEDNAAGSQPPFEPRSSPSRYDLVIACAVQPLNTQPGRGSSARIVVCIDLVRDDYSFFNQHEAFAIKIILFFTVFIARAASSMKVNYDELVRHVSNRPQ